MQSSRRNRSECKKRAHLNQTTHHFLSRAGGCARTRRSTSKAAARPGSRRAGHPHGAGATASTPASVILPAPLPEPRPPSAPGHGGGRRAGAAGAADGARGAPVGEHHELHRVGREAPGARGSEQCVAFFAPPSNPVCRRHRLQPPHSTSSAPISPGERRREHLVAGGVRRRLQRPLREHLHRRRCPQPAVQAAAAAAAPGAGAGHAVASNTRPLFFHAPMMKSTDAPSSNRCRRSTTRRSSRRTLSCRPSRRTRLSRRSPRARRGSRRRRPRSERAAAAAAMKPDGIIVVLPGTRLAAFLWRLQQ